MTVFVIFTFLQIGMKIDFLFWRTDIGNLIEDIGAFFAPPPLLYQPTYPIVRDWNQKN